MPGPRDVLRFPPSSTLTVDQALDSAKQRGPKDVVVVGVTEDGDLITRSSRMTRAEALWIIEQARRWLLDP